METDSPLQVIGLLVAVLGFLFGSGYLVRARPKLQVMNGRLVVDYTREFYVLRIEGQIANIGDKDVVLTKAKTLLYLEDGPAIASKFAFGIKERDDDVGFLLPRRMNRATDYDLGGHGLDAHNEKLVDRIKNGDPVVRVALYSSGTKPFVFRCNSDGMIIGTRPLRRIREVWKRLRTIR